MGYFYLWGGWRRCNCIPIPMFFSRSPRHIWDEFDYSLSMQSVTVLLNTLWRLFPLRNYRYICDRQGFAAPPLTKGNYNSWATYSVNNNNNNNNNAISCTFHAVLYVVTFMTKCYLSLLISASLAQCLPVISVYVRLNTHAWFRGKCAAICSYSNVSWKENNQSSTK